MLVLKRNSLTHLGLICIFLLLSNFSFAQQSATLKGTVVNATDNTPLEGVSIVRKERSIEMAFEGLRYFDLKRWTDLQVAYQRATTDNVTGYRPLYQAAKANVFAVPESELNANGGLGQILA